MTKAVLFDMDGLLVDTENVDLGVAVKICREMGIDLTDGEKESRVGVGSRKFYSELFEKRGVHFDLEEVLSRHFKIYDELLEVDLRHFPGAKSLPALLRSRGYKLGLVSGSTRKQVETILSQLGITEFFDVIVTVDDVAIGKPDPASYLLAAQHLRVKPGECVVLEDAVPGITAGKRAGMKVIGVTNNGGQDLSLADLVVNGLDEVEIGMLT